MSEPNEISSPPVSEGLSERELELREREIAARERELKAKEAEFNKSPWLSPLVIGLFVAAIGLIGNSAVALLNNQNSQAVEHFRAQSNLVIGAIGGGGTGADQQKACRNLLFLRDLRLVDDEHGAIQQVCIFQPQKAPSLGSNNDISGPIPPIATNNAPVGAKYRSTYTKNGQECVNETTKVSATEWQERTATPDNPPACQADAVIFPYTERESSDSRYFLLYDESRNLFARIPNIPVGQTGPSDWRLVSNQTWNAGRIVTRVN